MRPGPRIVHVKRMQRAPKLGYSSVHVAKEHQSPGSADEPAEGTAPQWQPPAGATRSVVIAPPAEKVGVGQPAPTAPPSTPEPQAPSVSGTRSVAQAQIGLA